MLRWIFSLVLAVVSMTVSDAYARAGRHGDDLVATHALPPMPVRVDGRPWMSYEVHLANGSHRRIRITELVATDARTGRELLRLEGRPLMAATAIEGVAPGDGSMAPAIAPGQRATLFLDFALPRNTSVARIRHQIGYVSDRTADPATTVTDTVALRTAGATRIAPPLRGGPWVAVHSPAWPNGHRRVFYTVAGQARLPARFAIDFVKVDAAGHTARNDPDVASNAYGYGEDVLAVADAVVASVRDGMDEPARISRRVRHPPDEEAGNYVALRLPDGRFAFYEHLRKNSIKVRTGQRVASGQVIGSLGFSGESTGPHLHFHLANADSPLGAEGVPFEFDRFRQLGRYDDLSALGTRVWSPVREAASNIHQAEWPDSNAVIVFGP